MNPDNKALARTYFIGGPPRIGKSVVAYSLASRINAHVGSTDAIRNAVKKAIDDKTGPLFGLNSIGQLSDDEWLDLYINKTQDVIDVQNNESEAYWRSIISYANSFCEDNAMHVLEGVAIIPKLVYEMQHKPEHIIFVGNTSDIHYAEMLNYARSNPERDWMNAMKYSDEKIKAMSIYVQKMSEYFRDESAKYGFEYIEINDNTFEASIDAVTKSLLD